MHQRLICVGLLWLAFIALTMTTPAQTNKAPVKLSPDQQAVLHVEEEIFAAVKNQNASALARMLADDFVYRSPGHQEVGKDAFLKLATSLPVKITAIWGEELKVNIFGDVAVLTGLQLARTRSGANEEAVSAVMFTDLFVKREGRWLLILAHAVDLPQVPSQYLPKQ